MNMGRSPGRVEVIGAVLRGRLSSGHRAHRHTALLPSAPCPLQKLYRLDYILVGRFGPTPTHGSLGAITNVQGWLHARKSATLGRALPYLRHAVRMLSKTDTFHNWHSPLPSWVPSRRWWPAGERAGKSGNVDAAGTAVINWYPWNAGRCKRVKCRC